MQKPDLNFVDRMFYTVEDGQKVNKPILRIDCTSEVPRYLCSDYVYILKNYKSQRSRGRRDILKNKDVIAFQTEKGLYQFPLEQLEALANYFYSLHCVLNSEPGEE